MDLSLEQFYRWFGLNRALLRWLADIHFPAWDWATAFLNTVSDPVHFPWYVGGALLTAYVAPRLVAPGNAMTFAIGFAPLLLAAAHLRTAIGLPRAVDLAEVGVRAAAVLKAGDGAPSATAAFVFFFAASLAPGAPAPARIFLWILAVLAATARVAAGTAFPADVAGGAVLAILFAWILRTFLRLIGPAGA